MAFDISYISRCLIQNLENMVSITISREDIYSGNIDPVRDVLESAAERGALAELAGSIVLDIEPGEEEDPGVETRWFLSLDASYPFILYFLSPMHEYQRYCSIFVPYAQTASGIQFDYESLIAFLSERLANVRLFCERNGLEFVPIKDAVESIFSIEIPDELISKNSDSASYLEEDVSDSVEDYEPPVPEFAHDWPFQPRELLHRKLIKTFRSKEIFPYKDIAGDAVLFALVENPVVTFQHPIALRIELDETPYYPLIMLSLVLFDKDGEAVKLSYPFDVTNETHIQWITKAATQQAVSTNILFKRDDTLYWAFTVPVEVGEFGAYALELLDKARALLEMIPEEMRDYTEAINSFAKETISQFGSLDDSNVSDDRAELEAGNESDVADTDMDEFEELPKEAGTITIDAEVVPDEYMVQIESTDKIKSPYDKSGKKLNLEDRKKVEQIERVLQAKIVKPEVSVTEKLALKPDTKKVKKVSKSLSSAGIDQDEYVQALSRKIMFLENKVEEYKRRIKGLKDTVATLEKELDECRNKKKSKKSWF